MQCTQKMLEYLLTCRIILIVQRRPRSLQVTAVCHNDSGQVLTSFLHIMQQCGLAGASKTPSGQTSVGTREGLARSPLHEKLSSIYHQLSKSPQ